MELQYRAVILSGLIAAVVGLLAGYLGGRQAPPPSPAVGKVVRAERFQLTDGQGRVRGTLGVDDQGAAHLALFGKDAAQPLVSLAADPQGKVSLELGDPQHQGAVSLRTGPQDSPQIALYEAGVLRLNLEAQKDAEPAVNFYDKGHRVITLGLTPHGNPLLAFYGEGEKPAVDLAGKKNGDRRLTLFSKNGTPRVVLGVKEDKKVALGLFDSKGKTRVALMDEPSLILLKNGKVVRTLP